MENQIIGDIARRIAKTKRFTETAELQAQALREQGYSPYRILEEVRKTLNANPKYMRDVALETIAYKAEVSEIIRETVNEAQEWGNELIANAGMMSYREDLALWKEHGIDLKKPNTLAQLNRAYAKQTLGDLKNLTRSTGSLYINGASLKNAYRHELDLALIKIASGGFSFSKALDDCCHNLAKSGVKVKYPSGKTMSIEAASRMCLKTGLSQLSGKITEENIKSTGVSLVYVSAHAGARPEHQVWQGQVYTYQGRPSSKYPDFVESTGYGTVTGLKGVNCSHEFYPHWEGDKIPEFHEPKPRMISGKEYTYYEATQQQRKMEREARELKREIEAQRAVGNNEKLSELNKKLDKLNTNYKSFSEAAGLRPKTERMSIPSAKKPKKDNATGKKRKNRTEDIKIFNPNITKKTKANTESFTKRMSQKESEKYARILNRTPITNKTDLPCCCNGRTININPLEEHDFTACHEAIHIFDFEHIINHKFTSGETAVYNSLGMYIDGVLWDEKKKKEDYEIIDKIFDLKNGRAADDDGKAKAFMAFENLVKDAGIDLADVDLMYVSDFASALTWDSTLGLAKYGGHSEEYWNDQENRMSEMLASYGLLNSLGRKDLLELEKKMAPNLYKIIETEWKKRWM